MEIKPEKNFCVTWFRYPHGIEGESMESNSREFSTFESARKFLEKRTDVIKGVNWAGGYIEDQNGKMLYDITDQYSITDYRL